MTAPDDGLLEHREQFLAFLKARLRNADLAEDVLQAAYLKSLEKRGGLRKDENVVAWFYRILRNTLADHYRRARVRERTGAAAEPASDPRLERTACRCVAALVPSIKPEYAELITRVDLEGVPVQEVALRLGMTPNNASVRLHRARKALKDQVLQVCGACATHGCVDCSCRGA